MVSKWREVWTSGDGTRWTDLLRFGLVDSHPAQSGCVGFGGFGDVVDERLLAVRVEDWAEDGGRERRVRGLRGTQTVGEGQSYFKEATT